MNKKLSPLVLVALSLILLSPVSVSAKSPNTPTIGFWNGKMAAAMWDLETPTPEPPFAAVLLMLEEVPVKISHIMVIVVNPPYTIYVLYKELAPGEFEWSIDHARVSTEIEGVVIDQGMIVDTLVVEWETVSPTETGHTNEYETFPEPPEPPQFTTHWIENMAGRNATATLTWGSLTLEMTGNVARSSNVGVTKWES